MDKATQVKEQIAQLQQALVSANPGMPTMLRTIHSALRNDPDTVTLLTDDEVGILVAGLMKQSNATIAAGAVKKKSTSAALKNIGLDDL